MTFKTDPKKSEDGFNGNSWVFKRARMFVEKNREESESDMEAGTTGKRQQFLENRMMAYPGILKD